MIVMMVVTMMKKVLRPGSIWQTPTNGLHLWDPRCAGLYTALRSWDDDDDEDDDDEDGDDEDGDNEDDEDEDDSTITTITPPIL